MIKSPFFRNLVFSVALISSLCVFAALFMFEYIGETTAAAYLLVISLFFCIPSTTMMYLHQKNGGGAKPADPWQCTVECDTVKQFQGVAERLLAAEGFEQIADFPLEISIPPKTSVSSFMGYLKGKSALMIFDKHANLKYKFGNRHV